MCKDEVTCQSTYRQWPRGARPWTQPAWTIPLQDTEIQTLTRASGRKKQRKEGGQNHGEVMLVLTEEEHTDQGWGI